MKKFKLVSVLLVAILMAVVAVGCSDDGETSAEGGNEGSKGLCDQGEGMLYSVSLLSARRSENSV